MQLASVDYAVNNNDNMSHCALLQASDFTDIGDWPTLGTQGEVCHRIFFCILIIMHYKTRKI